MEKYMEYSKNKSVDCKSQTEDSPEESSWSFYLQDQLICENNDDDEHSLSSCGYESISDAGSSSPPKKAKINNHDQGLGFSCERSNKCKSSTHFRKPKAKAALMDDDDDDLQDTAISPLNSPQVSYMNQFEKKQKEKATEDLSEVKRSGSSHSRYGVVDQGKHGEISELKKRGLCLVPLSKIQSYFSF